jgi:hypothetical protein
VFRCAPTTRRNRNPALDELAALASQASGHIRSNLDDIALWIIAVANPESPLDPFLRARIRHSTQCERGLPRVRDADNRETQLNRQIRPDAGRLGNLDGVAYAVANSVNP